MREMRSGLIRRLTSPAGLVLVVMAVIAAPVLLLGELGASDAHARVEQRDLAATADAATQAAGLISVHLRNLADELQSISRTDAFLATTSAQDWPDLTGLLFQYKAAASSDIERLLVFDAQPIQYSNNLANMAIRAEYPAADRLGQPRPATDYAAGVLRIAATGGFGESTKVVARAFVASHSDGPPTVALTTPIIPRPGTNFFEGFVDRGYAFAADIQVSNVTAWLAPMNDAAQRIYVIDETGKLLAGGPATQPQRSDLRDEPVVIAGSKKVAAARGNDPFAGSSRLLAAAPLTASDWIVVASRDTSAGLAELDAVASQQRILRIGLVVALLLGTIKVGRLTQRLQRQGIALEVASRHKSEFLANMSHELRTPLNAVIGFSDVLLQRMFGELNERQEEYVRDIREAGAHQLALVNDILDLSKVEAGRMELELSQFSLAALVADATALLRERASQKGVRLIVTADETLGSINADQRKIKQVLFNLLMNAIKFTPSGGAITIAGQRTKADVSVSVTDTGIGIAAADQTRIFEEFRQAGDSAGRAIEGTGLGLSLAKRFVELHGGTISVVSAPDRGSVFTFTLPQPAAT